MRSARIFIFIMFGLLGYGWYQLLSTDTWFGVVLFALYVMTFSWIAPSMIHSFLRWYRDTATNSLPWPLADGPIPFPAILKDLDQKASEVPGIGAIHGHFGPSSCVVRTFANFD